MCEIWHYLGWLFMATRSCPILLLNPVVWGGFGGRYCHAQVRPVARRELVRLAEGQTPTKSF